MFSPIFSALNRLHFLRGTVVVFTLVSLVYAGYDRQQRAAQAEESLPATPSELAAVYSTFPLSFTANAGQLDPRVNFHVRGMGSDLFFMSREVWLALPASTLVHLDFVGANEQPAVVGVDKLIGIANYLYGSDPAEWITNVPTYGGIVYEQLYPGISLHYTGTQNSLKGTYLIDPGADARLIRWRYDGVTRVQLDPATGDLRLYLPGTESYITELAPRAWQEIGSERIPVEVSYTLSEDGTIGFVMGGYDPAHTVYLDPELQFSSYLGGAATDYGSDIAIDNAGNMYVTGRTDSITFPPANPVIIPPVQASKAGAADAYVAKMNVASGTVIYSTYLGGTFHDEGTSIAVDNSGNAYLTGFTDSGDFPHSTGSFVGGIDVFVAKLSTAGSGLAYSVFLGGSGTDRGRGIAIDGSGNAYVTGDTSGGSPTSFPTDSAFDNSYNGGLTDAFVARFAPDGSRSYSSFLGGNGDDSGQDIAVDSLGNAYITGGTDSTANFPTVSASQSTNGGFNDAFVTKVSSTPAVSYSTYLGGGDDDEGRAIVVNGSGEAFVTGSTISNNFPTAGTTPVVGDPDAGGYDAFVTRFGSGGARVYSTYIGGTNDDHGEGIGLDAAARIYVTGYTQGSSAWPIVNTFPYVWQHSAPDLDIFVAALSTGGATFEYSVPLGGTGTDQGFSVAVSSGGSVYLTGNTASVADNPGDPNDKGFPQKGGLQRGGGTDGFVMRIGSAKADITVNKSDIGFEEVAVGQTMTYTITVNNHGPDPSDVIMTDALPAEMDFVSATMVPPSGSCTFDPLIRTVSCNLGTMLKDQPVTISLNLLVIGAPASGRVFNTARVTGTESDPVSYNNLYQQVTYVIAKADLAVSKEANWEHRVHAGESLEYTVSIHNLGPGSSSGVTLTDVLPAAYLDGILVAVSQGSYDQPSGVWTVGTIFPNATVTLTVNATVKIGVPDDTEIINTAGVNSTDPDPNPSNNSDSVILTVVPDYPDIGCHPLPADPTKVICLSG